jgi:hypothetical protein
MKTPLKLGGQKLTLVLEIKVSIYNIESIPTKERIFHSKFS